MITAVLYREGENLTGCRLEGHSGWAESGHDIVCAAASILGCTCVNALESVCGVAHDGKRERKDADCDEDAQAGTERSCGSLSAERDIFH